MSVHFNREQFTRALKEFRANRKQSEIAEEFDISRPTLSMLENGKQLPDIDMLAKICGHIGLKPETFFYKEESNPVVMMMGQMRNSDQDKFQETMERIAVRQKYLAMAGKCGIKP
ncbi:MAG: helix-turn-helix transcriptional regulator [Eubacteriales bacterium]|nr:helix-turn-helix transcriptional regulator [Eubacteriales bacterium]